MAISQDAQTLNPNPFDLNPLRDIISQQIDFAALRRDCPIKLFIAATHANSRKHQASIGQASTLDLEHLFY